MITALRYWYVKSPAWVWGSFLSNLLLLDGTLAIGSTLRNISKPIFQDYTYQGRIIGFFLRLFRLFASLVIYAALAVVYLSMYLLWLAFPVLCGICIVGSFAAPVAQTIK